MDRGRHVGCLRAPLLGLLIALAGAPSAPAQSLRVSAASMDLQNEQALRHGFTYARTSDDVENLIALGALVRIQGNQDFAIKEGVLFPFARAEVREFLEELSSDYRDACGEQLVVTSLTRPRNRQPRHASKRSVHPAGMAIDLRRSWSRDCRSWLEMALLTLEAHGVLDAMLESNPPHYHVALFPDLWREKGVEALEEGGPTHYEVHRGDTLSKIAARHNTDVFSVQQLNGLRSSRIYVGQVLKLPSGSR